MRGLCQNVPEGEGVMLQTMGSSSEIAMSKCAIGWG